MNGRCRYPDKSEVTIKRITTVFDKPVAPEIVLKMYRRNVDEKKKEKEHENFISTAQCRAQTLNGSVRMCIVYEDVGQGFVFDVRRVAGDSIVYPISHANWDRDYFNDNRLATNHARNTMARRYNGSSGKFSPDPVDSNTKKLRYVGNP